MSAWTSPRQYPERMFGFVRRRPRTVLALVAAVTLFFAWQLPRLSFSTSVYDLVIEDLPENTRYNEFKDVFGSDEIIRVVVKTDDVFDPETYARIAALSDALAGVAGVRRVISLATVRAAVDIGGRWPLDKFAAVIRPVKLFERNLLSADGRTAALTLLLANDADDKRVIAAVQGIIDVLPARHDPYQIGMPLVSRAMETFTRKDFLRLPPITFLLVVFILGAIFRRLRCIALPLLCVALSLLWTFGFIALTGISLSMLTMIVPVFLIAVGTAYCLHIVCEYRSWADKAQSPLEAVDRTFRHITFPTTLAVATTMVGLASLFLSRIPMIREFALFACFGMFSLLVIVLTVFPSALVLMPLPSMPPPGSAPKATRRLNRFLDDIVRLILDRQYPVLIAFVLLAVFCLMGVFRLQVETNPMGYFKPEIPVARHFHAIYRDLSGAFPVHIALGGRRPDFFEDPANLQILDRIQRFLERQPGVDKTISLADYLRLVNYAGNGFDPACYALPEEDWELRMLYNRFKTLLGEEVLHRFVTSDLAKTNLMMMTHLSSSRDFIALRRGIERYFAREFPAGPTWDATGFALVISASSDLLTRGQLKSLTLTMAVVFVIMFALFLSSKVALIAIVPNLFPILVNFGVMGWLGIELSMFTSLIASIAIGLAVDDTIHYMVRYNREFKRDLDDVRALHETLRHLGRPILFTTATISGGFSILAFSSFQPTAVFGLMMVVTMVSALIGDLLLLPMLMRHVQLVTLWDLVHIRLGMRPCQGIPLFRGLSRTEVYYIIVAGSMRRLPVGEMVFRKGDTSDSMYAVISGELEMLDHPPQVDPTRSGWDVKRLMRLQTGDIVGEMGLLRGSPRTVTVVATRPSALLQININMIRRLQWIYPPTAQRFFINLMNQLCDRIEHFSSFLTETSQWDDLSGFYNRRTFIILLDRELQRCRRYGGDLTLCLVRVQDVALDDAEAPQWQIDLFRQLPHHLRQTDVICRVDGHTLGLMLPKTTREEATHLHQRIRRVFERHCLKFSCCMVGTREAGQASGQALLDRAIHMLDALPLP